ncbi:TRAP-type putative transport system [Caenispirillum salinarum AK4]|uniref:TRAP-type putative transport system n=1 Tax=Caenispirillum salinarum AK4 TaxID=1238182 RepID=K9HFJ0_9PROT|nr:TRAP transporter permease [Caenispirillum salinarum]EKV29183.1 TRAP-type putative transport system [Caenispirillum salinarum AK4]
MADRQHNDDSEKKPHGAPPREADMGRPHVDAATEAEEDYGDFVAETETGARQPVGFAGKLLIGVALAWSLFQLYYASPLPYMIGSVLNSTEARSIHLAFAIFLAYTAYPAFKRSPRGHIPLLDWVFAIIGAMCAGYLYVFYRDLAQRPGLPITQDLVVAVVGMILLLEATRRALGPPLMIVALVFLLYTFGGPYMPDVIAHQGASLNKAASHYWLTTEGVFGVALGVSTSMVFLFVLFGSLLERAGAGNWFIRVAFALLGHFKGGPAKAAVVSSAMTGLISGSSIANVVTTGTFTIPLMKRVGFTSEKAGAVEVASSTNGQLTPPIMGAAAFLMVEYVGISYIEVMKHAILPALISYIALVYIVHLEAEKAGLRGLPRAEVRPWQRALGGFLFSFLTLAVLSAIVYFGFGWMKGVFGAATIWIAMVFLFVGYVYLLWLSTRVPEISHSAEISECPPVGPTVKAGLFYLLPVAVLIWCLMVERMSPGLAAFYAAVFMIFIAATQRPLKAMIKGAGDIGFETREGGKELFEGLVMGARNMIGIGVATAAAGVVVGTVTLTGVGLVMTEFVEFISGGNLMLMLIFTAIISLLLGMGLPTTANYIVVSTLMAPVIVTLGAEAGLVVPLIAVHMFVFYFGILADDTPPVGLAAFAAAAIAKSDPIKTGIQGFTYDMRTAILPFLFIFNTDLLLIGVTSVWKALMVFVVSVIAMFAFAAATQRWFFTRNRLWETLALLLIAFTLFRPGYWMDMIYPPYQWVEAEQMAPLVAEAPPGASIPFRVSGVTLEGEEVERTVVLPLGEPGTFEERLANAGITGLREEDGQMVVDMLAFGGPAEQAGVDFDFVIEGVRVPNDVPPKELMYIPALLLLAGLAAWQRRRRPHDLAAAREASLTASRS